MTAKEKEEVRQRLLSQREELIEDLHGQAATDQSSKESGDALDRAELETERGLNHQLLEDQYNLLGKIEFALRRLEAGTYETCTACGQTIPWDRLAAKPSVSLCLSCQQKKESQ